MAITAGGGIRTILPVRAGKTEMGWNDSHRYRSSLFRISERLTKGGQLRRWPDAALIKPQL